jgi:hypothetical protein
MIQAEKISLVLWSINVRQSRLNPIRSAPDSGNFRVITEEPTEFVS